MSAKFGKHISSCVDSGLPSITVTIGPISVMLLPLLWDSSVKSIYFCSKSFPFSNATKTLRIRTCGKTWKSILCEVLHCRSGKLQEQQHSNARISRQVPYFLHTTGKSVPPCVKALHGMCSLTYDLRFQIIAQFHYLRGFMLRGRISEMLSLQYILKESI